MIITVDKKDLTRLFSAFRCTESDSQCLWRQKKCDADHRVEEKEEEEEKTPKKPAEIPHRYSNTSTLISPNQHFALLKL